MSKLFSWIGVFGMLCFSSGISAQQEPKPRWEYAFTFRSWYSSAGIASIGPADTSSEGEGLAPGIELDAIRNKLLLRVTYQFDTSFRGTKENIDHSVERKDLDGALGWLIGIHDWENGNHIVGRALLGYKSLTLREDDIGTDTVKDDFRQSRQGPFAGIASMYRGSLGDYTDGELKLVVAYVYQETRISEKPANKFSYVKPYDFASDGWLFDLTYNIYLPVRSRNVQLQFGYKGQWYSPREDSVPVQVIRRDEAGEEVVSRNVFSENFESQGIVLGISFGF